MKIRSIFGIVIVFGIIAVGLFFYLKTDERLQIGYKWTQGTEQRYQLSISTNIRLVLPGSKHPRPSSNRWSGP